jgi:hypothetical protein
MNGRSVATSGEALRMCAEVVTAYPFLLLLLVNVAKDLAETRHHGVILHVHGAGDQVLNTGILYNHTLDER